MSQSTITDETKTTEADEQHAARVTEYEERKTNKAERFRNRAKAAEARSSETYDRARAATAGIPFGQPILVGHHSERRHRNAIEKSDSLMRRSIEEEKKAEYWEQRAENVEHNSAISSDDPDAVNKLRAKIADLEKSQEAMKLANIAVRKGDNSALVALVGEKAAAEVMKPDYMGRVGFPSYALSNNSAEIRRCKNRMASLEKLAAAAAEQPAHEIVIGEVRIVDNLEANRLQMIFPGKPSDEVRSRLKSSGFRWSPRFGAWQRHRGTQAMWAAEAIAKSLV